MGRPVMSVAASGPRTANVIRMQQRHSAADSGTATIPVIAVILKLHLQVRVQDWYLHYNTDFNKHFFFLSQWPLNKITPTQLNNLQHYTDLAQTKGGWRGRLQLQLQVLFVQLSDLQSVVVVAKIMQSMWLVERWSRNGGGRGRSAGDQTEDDSEISHSLHASLALVHVDLTDSPPPTQAVPLCGLWE